MIITKGIYNLHTEWLAKGDAVNVDNIKKTACYGSNFPLFSGHQSYVIWMYRDGDGFINNVRNNTFFDLGELIDHIQWIKNFLPKGIVGDFSIEEEVDQGKKFKLSIDITGSNIYHKLVLNWIRYAYELPYSLIIKDVSRLGDEFKELNRINKFILCSSIYTESSEYYWRTDMSFGHNTILHKDEDLLARLEKESQKTGNLEQQYLDDVFGDEIYNSGELTLPEDDRVLLETDNWVKGLNFEERLELYKHNFKIFGKEYEKETA